MNAAHVTKVDNAPTGEMGQQYLAAGDRVAMRRWEEGVCDFRKPVRREYETVGVLLEGELELELDGESVKMVAGDSWVVPADAPHRYRIIKPIVAIEATSPPGRVNDRDEPAS